MYLFFTHGFFTITTININTIYNNIMNIITFMSFIIE